MAELTYDPSIFDTPDLETAKRVILTPVTGLDTPERWACETPYVTDLLGAQLAPAPGLRVLDYGCGVGRMSKALIERFGCDVVGVDISPKMRAMAPDYVASPNFTVMSHRELLDAVSGGFRVDAAFSVWVLQHCGAPAKDIGLIRAALRDAGLLAVVNSARRWVPVKEKHWANDGIDVQALLGQMLQTVAEGPLDEAGLGFEPSPGMFWGTYRKP